MQWREQKKKLLKDTQRSCVVVAFKLFAAAFLHFHLLCLFGSENPVQRKEYFLRCIHT
jgi:hypothetical protein